MTHPPSPIDHRSDFPSRNYFPELDGLRFFAFLLVFCFHGGFPGLALRDLVGATAGRALREHGWVGVQLFFMISGFVILMTLQGLANCARAILILNDAEHLAPKREIAGLGASTTS